MDIMTSLLAVEIIMKILADRNALLKSIVEDLLEQHERQIDMEACALWQSYPDKFPEWDRAWDGAGGWIMTRKEVIELCMQVKLMPFCQLDYKSMGDGADRIITLTRRQYDTEMFKNRPWCTPWGEQAWYNDEVSEKLQDAWHVAHRKAQWEIRAWESSHKGRIPQWAKKF